MATVVADAGLAAVLRRFLALNPDARQITISTSEGAELVSEGRTQLLAERERDKEFAQQGITSVAPSFSTSVEQSSRLGLGVAQYAIVWAANSIVLQTKVEALIVSIVLDENCNLGMVEENISALRTLLLPFCSFST